MVVLGSFGEYIFISIKKSLNVVIYGIVWINIGFLFINIRFFFMLGWYIFKNKLNVFCFGLFKKLFL